MQSLKLIVVGDGEVGKTSLLVTYTQNAFPTDYTPTVYENYSEKLVLDGRTIHLSLWDTAGQESYDRLRPLAYPNTVCRQVQNPSANRRRNKATLDVFLLCFSVNSRDSFENVRNKWIPELRHHCPRVPVVLVATKLDLRQNAGGGKREQRQLISQSQGQSLANHIKAVRYLECSAKTQEGLQDVIFEAVRSVVRSRSRPGSGLGADDEDRRWRKRIERKCNII